MSEQRGIDPGDAAGGHRAHGRDVGGEHVGPVGETGVGPDGTGRIPEMSQRYLREVGSWLAVNGDSIYGTTHSPIPDQPWGVCTLKSNRLFLHIFTRPKDGVLFVPNFDAKLKNAHFLLGKKVKAEQTGNDLRIYLPEELPDERDTVVECEFTGTLSDSWQSSPVIISRQFNSFSVDAAKARVTGNAILKSETSSQYFGNWKHDTCAQGMQTPDDQAEFSFRFLEPGDYRVALEYSCPKSSAGREGVVEIGGQSLSFETLPTGGYDSHEPLIFFHHPIGIFSIKTPGVFSVAMRPKDAGTELFWLRRIIIEPAQ